MMRKQPHRSKRRLGRSSARSMRKQKDLHRSKRRLLPEFGKIDAQAKTLSRVIRPFADENLLSGGNGIDATRTGL